MLGALCTREDSGPKKSKTTLSTAGSPNEAEPPEALAGALPRLVPKRKLWTVGFGYRFQPSSRHFVGSEEQKQREAAGNQIQNTYHLFDLSISRDITPRWSLNASIPLFIADRNQLYVPRGDFRVVGQGDATVGVRAWLFRPPTESGGNVAIGVSLKLPTGIYNAMGNATDRNGRPIRATADQSIQAGDGGTGVAIDFQGYKPLNWLTNLYFSGVYLVNPRDTNGVSTFRTRAGEEYMSVADQYLIRGGISRGIPLPFLPSFTVSFGARAEGVPVTDLIGRSNGFRRPGVAVSMDPGFLFSYRNTVFSMNIPWAVYRNRFRSVTDIRNGVHGDAAFADYAIVFGLSRRF